MKTSVINYSFELERAAAITATDGERRRSIEMVAATGNKDRAGDRIIPEGIDLKSYRRNPIVLWQHNKERPIAKCTAIALEAGKLVARAEFPPAGIDSDADRIHGLITEGIINAVSVCLLPTKSKALDSDLGPFGSREIQQSELIELSIVSVPMNAETVITSREFQSAAETAEGVKVSGLLEVQKKRDHVLSQHQALSAMAADRALNDEEMETLKSYTDLIGTYDRRITQLKTIEEQKALLAKPVDMANNDVARAFSYNGHQASVLPMAKPLEKGEAFGLFARALAANKGIPFLAAQWVERHTGQMEVARALATAPAAAGGTLVPVQYATEFIEFVRPLSVVRRAQPRHMTFNGVGSIRIPMITGGATASYVGENQTIQYTELQSDHVLLTPKKIAAITALSNELVRRSNPSADAIVRDDLAAAVAQASDAQFLRGVGSAVAPKGLTAWALPAHIFNASAAGIEGITDDLAKAILLLRNAGARMIRPVWFLSATTEVNIGKFRDTSGNAVWKDEIKAGKLEGIPFYSSLQIPSNLGAGEDESQIILADMADVILAEELEVAIDVSQEASYVDGAGVMISSFANDQTVMRVIATHDFGVRHPGSIVVINVVQW